MKIMLSLILFLTAASAFAENNQSDEEVVCTTIAKMLDGEEYWWKVECDGPYAGKCLKEVRNANGVGTDLEIVACE